ncbi:hypothetical protein SAMD00023353_3100620 [Rosellinia necatrix]|uniref:Bacteriocin-protection protein n=1 Tax=Rosellinia necatrix TaxID=77044 RepID=A0A1W2TU33_ROSNE|nr:hypothetical protein SAMD00023353_3100620 [Rosellinia necatrix]
MPTDLPILTVADVAAWSNWLVRNATTSKGVWLSLSKKGHTAPTSLCYAQALDEALCQGWIDGQARGGDERSYSQRFTPRTPKSLWSRRNVEHIARLEKEGRVTALGRAAIDAAKIDGRWDAAYAGQSTAEPPPEFISAVAAVPKAQAMWDVLTRSNRYAIYFRLNALKTQAGREKRIAAFVEMLARGESPYPQKQKPAAVVSAGAGTVTLKKMALKNATTPKEEMAPKTATPTRARHTATARVGGGPVRRSTRLLKTTLPSP